MSHRQTPLRQTEENFRSEIVEDIAEESDADEASDDFDLPLKNPGVNSVKGGLGLVNKLAEFKDVLVDSQLQ